MRRIRTKHTDRFTVIPNALSQHAELSLRARGLAVLLLSLPDGADVSIKGLAKRLPEGEAAIAAALRELQHAGYLVRTVERLDNGRLVTRTVVRDVPAAEQPADSPAIPEPQPEPAAPADQVRPPAPEAAAANEPTDEPAAAPRTAPRPAPVASLGDLTPAARVLLDVAAADPRLAVGMRALPELAALVDQALAAGVSADQVRAHITSSLPTEIRSAAALIRHRLVDRLPTWQAAARLAALRTAPVTAHAAAEDPAAPARPRYVECDDCRAPMRTATADGLCSGCRPHAAAAA